MLGLVLAPTRELAQQVARQIDLLGSRRGIKTAAVYGGSSFEEQLALVADANIVIATPGRLLDVVKRKQLSLAKVRFFGLDEADEMLSSASKRMCAKSRGCCQRTGRPSSAARPSPTT